ncbi:MAG: serine/threonine protein kinase [Anaerolineaceae bacterium]|nr:MAG: serine/threonine protein kinase [Anaerolineaceae bacterium]
MSHVDQQIIGGYRVEQQVGSGGMATVYKAHQPKLNRPVALKVMHKMFSDDDGFISRFEREAQIVAALDHPNIVPIYDYAVHDNQPFLVMKYVDGQTLKDMMRAEVLTLDAIRAMMGAVCDALTYAHQQGVLHRDMKPSNILIGANGVPYLTDFGLARIIQHGESTLSVDAMLGTPHYISPEQAQGAAIDARTDVYATGIILYELVCGRLPFTGDTTYAIIHKQIHAAPPLPSKLNPDIPPALERVLLKALEKDADDRYDTANQLFSAFEAALQASSVTALDATRVERAHKLGDLISHHTPGGGHYSTAQGSSRPFAFYNADGMKSVIVPVLPEDTPPAKHSLNEWLEIFIGRIREMVDDFRQQLHDRSLRERMNTAWQEIEGDVKQVTAVAQDQLGDGEARAEYARKGKKAKKQDKKRKIAAPVASADLPGIRAENMRDWGLDEDSIRKRANARKGERTGLLIHALIFIAVIGLLFATQGRNEQFFLDTIATNQTQFAIDAGFEAAVAPQFGAALRQFASIPIWLVVGLMWGGGLIAHILQVVDKTADFRLRQRRERTERDMQLVYGAGWRDIATPKNYNRIRKSNDRRAKRRLDLLTHISNTFMMMLAATVALPPIEQGVKQIHALNTASPFPVDNWALIAYALLLIPLVLHGLVYAIGGLFGIDNRELSIQAEVVRQQRESAAYKRKNDEFFHPDDTESDDLLPQVRLTADGEFTDSFLQKVNRKSDSS